MSLNEPSTDLVKRVKSNQQVSTAQHDVLLSTTTSSPTSDTTQQPINQLRHFIDANNINAIQQLLASDPQLPFEYILNPTTNQPTPLLPVLYACQQGRGEIVIFLIPFTLSLLYQHKCQQYQENIISRLFQPCTQQYHPPQCTLDEIITNDDCNTLYHIAVESQHLEIITLLSQNYKQFDLITGCGINAQNGEGLTPLALACKLGFESIVTSLLQLNATVTIPSFDNQLPYRHAQKWAFDEDVTEQLSRCINNPDTCFLATLPVRQNQPSLPTFPEDTLDLILKRKFDFGFVTKAEFKQQPITSLFKSRSAQLLQFVLQSHPQLFSFAQLYDYFDSYLQNVDKLEPNPKVAMIYIANLMRLSREQHTQLNQIDRVRHHQYFGTIQNPTGSNPRQLNKWALLHQVTSVNDCEVIVGLPGVSLKSQYANSSPEGVISTQIQAGRVDIVQFLVAKFTEVDLWALKDPNSPSILLTYLEGCRDHKRDISLPFVEFLLAWGYTQLDQTNNEQVASVNERKLQLINAKHRHISDTMTPVDICSYLGRLDVLQLLIQHGAVIPLIGSTDVIPAPLHSAAKGCHIDVVQFLLSYPNFNTNMINIRGYTAVECIEPPKNGQCATLHCYKQERDVYNRIVPIQYRHHVDCDEYQPNSTSPRPNDRTMNLVMAFVNCPHFDVAPKPLPTKIRIDQSTPTFILPFIRENRYDCLRILFKRFPAIVTQRHESCVRPLLAMESIEGFKFLLESCGVSPQALTGTVGSQTVPLLTDIALNPPHGGDIQPFVDYLLDNYQYSQDELCHPFTILGQQFGSNRSCQYAILLLSRYFKPQFSAENEALETNQPRSTNNQQLPKNIIINPPIQAIKQFFSSKSFLLILDKVKLKYIHYVFSSELFYKVVHQNHPGIYVNNGFVSRENILKDNLAPQLSTILDDQLLFLTWPNCIGRIGVKGLKVLIEQYRLGEQWESEPKSLMESVLVNEHAFDITSYFLSLHQHPFLNGGFKTTRREPFSPGEFARQHPRTHHRDGEPIPPHQPFYHAVQNLQFGIVDAYLDFYMSKTPPQ